MSNNNIEMNNLNELNENELSKEFLRVCGCDSWVSKMIDNKPFLSLEQLLDLANSIWLLLLFINIQILFYFN